MSQSWNSAWAAEARAANLRHFGQPAQCKACGRNDDAASCEIADMAMVAVSFGRKPMMICAECADQIANVFSYKHSGELLTPGIRGWPEAPERPGQKRRKMSLRRAMRIFERDGYSCKRCGSQTDLQVDHIVALANGGTEDDGNLQTLCGPCNRRKGAR